MNKKLILLILIQLNCATIFLQNIVSLIGKPIDYASRNGQTSNDEYCILFSKVGIFFGIIIDVGSAISYAIMNPTFLPIFGSWAYGYTALAGGLFVYSDPKQKGPNLTCH